MEDLIKKVYQEKMNDGSFEKIISVEFEKMVLESCNDLFKWNGAIKKQMDEKINSIMSGLIERTDFNEYVTKLQLVINETIKHSSLGNFKEVAESIQKICGHPNYKYGDKIKLSDIFKKYIEWIEKEFDENDFNDDEINKDDGTKTASVDCSLDIEESYSKISVVLGNEKVEEHEETEIRFDLIRSYDSEETYNLSFNSDYKISDLRNMPSFIIYLLNLKQQYVKIEIDDVSDDEFGPAEFEFEWNID